MGVHLYGDQLKARACKKEAVAILALFTMIILIASTAFAESRLSEPFFLGFETVPINFEQEQSCLRFQETHNHSVNTAMTWNDHHDRQKVGVGLSIGFSVSLQNFRPQWSRKTISLRSAHIIKQQMGSTVRSQASAHPCESSFKMRLF